MAQLHSSNLSKPVTRLSLDVLHFDPQNPRFSRMADGGEQLESTVIERMVKSENVQELMGSIGEQGYFEGEPLLVAKDQRGQQEHYIVVEGNRRLAALKLLAGHISHTLPSISTQQASAKNRPTEIPCIIFEQRKDLLRYLGYRHITGPKRWDPLSKARYLKQLRDVFFLDLPEDEQYKAIAREIGSKSPTVKQILAGLTVYEQTKNQHFYGLQRVQEDDVSFSVLTTALAYQSIAEYIGLESPTDTHAANLNAEHTKDLFGWLFAQDQQGNTILGESRNLRKLAAVAANVSAIEHLKKGNSLEAAYLFSDGPANAFAKLLGDIEKKLLTTLGVAQELETYDFTEDHKVRLEKLTDHLENLDFIVGKAIRKKQKEER